MEKPCSHHLVNLKGQVGFALLFTIILLLFMLKVESCDELIIKVITPAKTRGTTKQLDSDTDASVLMGSAIHKVSSI